MSATYISDKDENLYFDCSSLVLGFLMKVVNLHDKQSENRLLTYGYSEEDMEYYPPQFLDNVSCLMAAKALRTCDKKEELNKLEDRLVGFGWLDREYGINGLLNDWATFLEKCGGYHQLG